MDLLPHSSNNVVDMTDAFSIQLAEGDLCTASRVAVDGRVPGKSQTEYPKPWPEPRPACCMATPVYARRSTGQSVLASPDFWVGPGDEASRFGAGFRVSLKKQIDYFRQSGKYLAGCAGPDLIWDSSLSFSVTMSVYARRPDGRVPGKSQNFRVCHSTGVSQGNP